MATLTRGDAAALRIAAGKAQREVEELLGRRGPGEARLNVRQLLREVGRAPGQRPVGCEPADEPVQLVMVVDGLLVECADKGTPVHLIGDPALTFEDDERLAYRNATHAQIARDGVLGDPHARPELPFENQAPDVHGDVLPTRRAHQLRPVFLD